MWQAPSGPARPAATLQASDHRHSTLADGRTPCAATAQVVFEDGGWKSWCPLCGTVTFGPEWATTPGVTQAARAMLDRDGAQREAELLADRERAHAAYEAKVKGSLTGHGRRVR